ncbi:MAG TPA: transcriptional repressor LexA [Candidatus Micrarchaeia archaeon]|nr:transcriptional repressor LexA [Candidatus Micrarchaeia archaeon]
MRPRSTSTLTLRQRQVLTFLRDYQLRYGASPTVRAVAESVGLRSPATAQHHLDELESKGYIHRRRDPPPAIQILRPALPERPVALVPLLGTVPSGAVPPSWDHIQEYVPAPVGDLRGDPGCFALRVVGDALVQAALLDGDLLFVRPDPEPGDGALVVARQKGAAGDPVHLVIRRISCSADRAELLAGLPGEEPRPVASVEILGVVVGVLRGYGAEVGRG